MNPIKHHVPKSRRHTQLSVPATPSPAHNNHLCTQPSEFHQKKKSCGLRWALVRLTLKLKEGQNTDTAQWTAPCGTQVHAYAPCRQRTSSCWSASEPPGRGCTNVHTSWKTKPTVSGCSSSHVYTWPLKDKQETPKNILLACEIKTSGNANAKQSLCSSLRPFVSSFVFKETVWLVHPGNRERKRLHTHWLLSIQASRPPSNVTMGDTETLPDDAALSAPAQSTGWLWVEYPRNTVTHLLAQESPPAAQTLHVKWPELYAVSI